tara:strand:+ start:1858 stop:3018 length:1161 start_codon:yes stop_codon:yes gene_type:complete
MGDLGDFFSLIGEEKKKKKEEKDDLVGDISLESLFASLSEEKKKNKSKIEEKAREREKLIKDAKVFESFLFSETKTQSLTIKKAINVLEKELLNLKSTSHRSIDRLMRGICSEYKITPRQLHDSFKQKHSIIPDEWVKQQKEEVDTTNWRDDYVPTEIETTNIIEPEPLKKEEELEESVEELETLSKIRDDVNVEVDKSNNILKSIEILDKLNPDEEIDSDGKDSDVNRLRREIDQLRKMVYETVRHTSTIGGGGAGFIKDLDDVNIAGLQNGYVLVWDEANNQWSVEQKFDLGRLAGLATADPNSFTNGDIIAYDGTTGQFISTSVVGAATTNIAGYGITVGIPDDNTVLTFNQTDQKWIFDSPFNIVDLSDGIEDGNQDYGSFE